MDRHRRRHSQSPLPKHRRIRRRSRSPLPPLPPPRGRSPSPHRIYRRDDDLDDDRVRYMGTTKLIKRRSPTPEIRITHRTGGGGGGLRRRRSPSIETVERLDRYLLIYLLFLIEYMSVKLYVVKQTFIDFIIIVSSCTLIVSDIILDMF